MEPVRESRGVPGAWGWIQGRRRRRGSPRSSRSARRSGLRIPRVGLPRRRRHYYHRRRRCRGPRTEAARSGPRLEPRPSRWAGKASALTAWRKLSSAVGQPGIARLPGGLRGSAAMLPAGASPPPEPSFPWQGGWRLSLARPGSGGRRRLGLRHGMRPGRTRELLPSSLARSPPGL